MGVVLNRYHHVFSIVYYFAYFQCHHLLTFHHKNLQQRKINKWKVERFHLLV